MNLTIIMCHLLKNISQFMKIDDSQFYTLSIYILLLSIWVAINPWNAAVFLYKPWRPKGFSIWNHHKCLSSFGSFEYLCYGSTVIFSVVLTLESDVSNTPDSVDPRPEGVKEKLQFVGTSLKDWHAADTTRWRHIGLMLGQSRRRWNNIKSTQGQRLVSAWYIISWTQMWCLYKILQIYHSSSVSKGNKVTSFFFFPLTFLAAGFLVFCCLLLGHDTATSVASSPFVLDSSSFISSCFFICVRASSTSWIW